MAKLPAKKSEENTGEWLNTYADMVTLLLTFFVLLFACSNLDETKLQYVFQEFKSRGHYLNKFIADQDPYANGNGGVTDNTAEPGGEGSMPQSFEELYTYLADYVEENSLSQSISVEQGDSHIRIRFDSSIMFDGNSSYLKPEGKRVLDGMVPAIRAVKSSISRNTVSGHTAYTTEPSVVNDWNLSALRAVSVVNYLNSFGKEYNPLEEEKYRVMGCGPYEPADEEDPAKNRRVEMLLLYNELDITDPKVIQDILANDYNIPNGLFDPEKPKDSSETQPPGTVDKIIDFINEKFKPGNGTTIGQYGPTAVDGDKFLTPTESGGTGGDTSS